MHKFKQLVSSLIKSDNNNSLLNNASPEFCARLVTIKNENVLNKLLVKIKASNTDWIVKFIQENGFFEILNSIENICDRQNISIFYKSILLSKYLQCIELLMNKKVGMEFIIDMAENKECIQILSKGEAKLSIYMKKFNLILEL
jgi:hypothetical protein